MLNREKGHRVGRRPIASRFLKFELKITDTFLKSASDFGVALPVPGRVPGCIIGTS